jgi:hypothetical protein
MKTLQFNFGHPVTGIVTFFNKVNPGQRHTQAFNTQSGECDISIEHLPEGSWKATLEWDYDGKDYCYEEEFEILKA